jgi:hypothetical protein
MAARKKQVDQHCPLQNQLLNVVQLFLYEVQFHTAIGHVMHNVIIDKKIEMGECWSRISGKHATLQV